MSAAQTKFAETTSANILILLQTGLPSKCKIYLCLTVSKTPFDERQYNGSDLDPSCTRGLILRRNWDQSLKSFPPCYSQSPLLSDCTLGCSDFDFFSHFEV